MIHFTALLYYFRKKPNGIALSRSAAIR